MKKLTWLFLGNIAAGHASRTTTTGTQGLEVATGDIFEPAEYLRVTLDGGDSTEETALTLSYVQAERGLVTATVGQVYTSAFQVTFPDGDIQRLQAGAVERRSLFQRFVGGSGGCCALLRGGWNREKHRDATCLGPARERGH